MQTLPPVQTSLSPKSKAMLCQCKPFALHGTFCHTPTIGAVEVLKQQLVVVNGAGTITYLGPADGSDAEGALQQLGLQQEDITTLGPSQFLLPGFIDTHCHAPQYAFTGVGTDLPLFDWLHRYTFPCESSFRDTQHAEGVYRHAVQRMLRLGTTTSNYFTTLHVDACKVLVDVIEALGQRAVVGKVCMDQHGGPDDYLDPSTEASLQGSRQVVDYIKSKGCGRIMASVVPRFIPTCSQQLLEGLGSLAQEAGGIHIHSHISESREQVEFSQQLHPGAPHDAAIYDTAGLLTSRAIFAHATQLTQDALQLMAAKGAAVAHCPLSNFYFGDGLFCVAQALAYGVKVGLGTDVAGGYSPSMLQAIRMAVINSHALKAAALMGQQQQKVRGQQAGPSASGGDAPVQTPGGGLEQLEPHGATAGLAGSKVAAAISSPAVSAAALRHQLSWEDALYLATAGGAAALGLEKVVGHFAQGLEFDGMLVDCGLPEVFDVLQDRDDPLVLLEHFLHNGDDRNIIKVWVQGRQCKPVI